MAGANNAQMKVAGWKARDIVKARATHGKLSHDTMASGGFALRKGFERPATKAKGPKAEPPAGWQAAARGDSPGARARSDAAKAEARAVYQRGNEGARGKVGDMRSDIRGRVSAVRAADTKHRDAIASARSRAERANPAVKGGKDAQRRKLERERKVDEAITRDPTVQQTARDRKAAREGLSAALTSRDAVARGRKQAATPGQMDLFGAAPQRGPSPFEKKQAVAKRNLGYATGLAERVRQARRDAPARIAAETKARAARDFKANAHEEMRIRSAQLKAKADAKAKAAAEKAYGERVATARTDANKAAGLRTSSGLMAARRAQAAKAASAERAKIAGIAGAVERSAAMKGRFKVERNVPITVAVRSSEKDSRGMDKMTTAQGMAIAKAGGHAVVKSPSGRYNLTHLGSGMSVTTFSTKAGAMAALNGMASGRNKASDRMAAGDYSGRSVSAMMRYTTIASKREAAYELNKAHEAHDRAVAGGNQAVIRGAKSRLDSAKKSHASWSKMQGPSGRVKR